MTNPFMPSLTAFTDNLPDEYTLTDFCGLVGCIIFQELERRKMLDNQKAFNEAVYTVGYTVGTMKESSFPSPLAFAKGNNTIN
jgi:hypothetical protein